MSIRWRKDGALLCAAKHKVKDGDTYIGDCLHYSLAVETKILKPTKEEKENGLWYIKYSHKKAKKKESEFMKMLLLLRQQHTCPLCSTLIKQSHECNFDHKQPDSKGGCHTIDNLQITHIHCNRKKGNKVGDNQQNT